jgi:hypothetical protein
MPNLTEANQSTPNPSPFLTPTKVTDVRNTTKTRNTRFSSNGFVTIHFKIENFFDSFGKLIWCHVAAGGDTRG